MQDNQKELEQLNIRVGVEESKGDDKSRNWLNGIIAPQLAFRRANGATFDNRDDFLKKITSSDPRETEVVSIDLYGKDRAIVACVVTVKSKDGDKRYHNARKRALSRLNSWYSSSPMGRIARLFGLATFVRSRL